MANARQNSGDDNWSKPTTTENAMHAVRQRNLQTEHDRRRTRLGDNDSSHAAMISANGPRFRSKRS